MYREQERVVVLMDGQNVLLEIRRPTDEDWQQSQAIYDRRYRRELKRGAITRDQVYAYATSSGMWDKARADSHAHYMCLLAQAEELLPDAKGEEAQRLAEQMRFIRSEADRIRAPLTQLESSTAEAHAEQSRFNHIVKSCTTVVSTRQPAFKDGVQSNCEAWQRATAAMGRLLLNIDDNEQVLAPEERVLAEHALATV
jgi:hypothetical protein